MRDAETLLRRAVEVQPDLWAAHAELGVISFHGPHPGADFPPETEALFERTLALVEDWGLTWLHFFPYSARTGTPAARMPQVPPPVVKARAKRLREACAERRAAWLRSLIGTRQRVLIEKDGFGHAENFAPVHIDAGADGTIVEARIVAAENGTLTGVPA